MRNEDLVRYLRFIAANTRRYRLKRSLTQEALAEIADLDLRFVQRIERGTTNLSISVLIALASALDVPPTALFREAKLSPARPGRPRKISSDKAPPSARYAIVTPRKAGT